MATEKDDDAAAGGGKWQRPWRRQEVGPNREPPPERQDLPSEQDRKAVVGCLAAVLNTTCAARRRRDGAPAAAPTANEGADDGAGGGEGDPPAAANFSIRPDEDEAVRPSDRRMRSFQREVLTASAELLLLSPDHAAVFLPNLDIECADDDAAEALLLRPFLESLSGPDASFRCVALLMLRFLLLSGEDRTSKGDSKSDNDETTALRNMTIVGYDARVRFAFKYLAVFVLSHWEMKAHGESFLTPERAAAQATRKFEALEDGIAARLSAMSEIMRQEGKKSKGKLGGQKQESTFGQNAIRGLKIGAAGVAAGTVFAITGGLAAPAIVGGIAALTGVSSAVTVVASILLLPAATTIFGVGGGTLVASKMSKRTAGLKDFDIVKITPDGDGGNSDADSEKKADGNNPDLSRTVCIGGWMRDVHDAERPFGATPRGLVDRHELLCRYCSVYAPQIVPDCRRILKEWQGREDELWDLCKASYGKDPDSLLPFETGPRYDALLTKSEDAAVNDLMRAMGLPFPERNDGQSSPPKDEPATLRPMVNLLSEVLASDEDGKKKDPRIDPVTLRSYRAWDFHAEYGSEQYVILWEKELLMELHGSAKRMQASIATKAAGEALKKTAMASLMAAVALPSALLSLSNMIDEQWTIAAERSDEAGVLLAHSLLNSSAGHRPVSLVGFSFGARMIIACLKELARNQAIWERRQEGTEQKDSVAASIRKNLHMSNHLKEAQSFTREPASIVEDVILMGCPASVNSSKWLLYREIVGGRVVNCYSKHDMILALMYRVKNIASSLLTPPVGIGHVDVAGIENFDVSKFVGSHGEYCVAVREILNLVGYNQPAYVRAREKC